MENVTMLTQWLLSAVSNIAGVITSNFGVIGVFVLAVPLLRKITNMIRRLFSR